MGPKGVVGENFDGFRLNGKQEWLTSSDRADVSDTYGGSGMFASPGKDPIYCGCNICYVVRMMEHGLLSPEKARKAYEKKQRRLKELRTGTPIKSSKPSSKPESSQKHQLASKNGDVKAKKRINNDIDDDDDYLILSPKRRKG
ncbi:hypothetical protein QQP08_024129 [Theobroma cacao]|nr:hypothetical protein QQP08_024129 [Theobroma cacao]